MKKNYVPYQCCPICNGTGKITIYPPMSIIETVCDVCNGTKIIPMHLIETTTERKEG